MLLYKFSRVFKSLIDISKNFILIEFGKFSRLIESGKSLKYKIDTSGNLKLINFSRFSKF